jgi:hypothetical protein
MSQPEIITVNSEQLQSTVRDLLPSQAGFGSELQASNVITPIIDLTAAAEGSNLPSYLQTALAFGSQTSFLVENTTTTILNQTGFFRIFMTVNTQVSSAASVELTDGVTSKEIVRMNGIASDLTRTQLDFFVFLRAGDSVDVISTAAGCVLTGSTRQIATGDGTLVQPVGFPL